LLPDAQREGANGFNDHPDTSCSDFGANQFSEHGAGTRQSTGGATTKMRRRSDGVPQSESLPATVQGVLEPLLKEVESLTDKIKDSDQKIEQITREDYPETAPPQQVGGVGPLIALTFVLTVEGKDRFQKSRDIGCYLGLRPRRSDSG
jgi:transposase